MANASRDDNRVPTLIGTSSADGRTPVAIYADPTTHRLKIDASAGVAGLGKSGTTVLTGTISLSEGTNITLTQTSQDIKISSTAVTSPAGSTTQVQFNDAGSFAGDSGLTFNKTTDQLTVGSLHSLSTQGFSITADSDLALTVSAAPTNTMGGGVTVTAGDGNGTATGGTITLIAGTAGATADGGGVSIYAGDGGATSGYGGDVTILAGSAQNGGYNGGYATLQAGNANGAGYGGDVAVYGGAGNVTGNGGSAYLNGGIGGTVSGDAASAYVSGGAATLGAAGGAVIRGGTSLNGNGGNVTLTAGRSVTGGTNGSVKITHPSGAGVIVFDTSPLSAARTFSYPNQTGTMTTVISGAGVPGSTPVAIGQIYINTGSSSVYISAGTTNSSDWKLVS